MGNKSKNAHAIKATSSDGDLDATTSDVKPGKSRKGKAKAKATSAPLSEHQPSVLRPSVRNMPTITFQPHHTEISTDRPSVSGRLLLHIPKVAGRTFEFVSLTLTLRLKESIAWTRQDLTSFEIQKESWSQTVWEKSIKLNFQDKQVEEGEDTVVKVRRNAGSKSSPPSPRGSIELPMDEWRWEWLMPVTRNEVWPESFEGSMGMVWYEIESKCHFRWLVESQNSPLDLIYTPIPTNKSSSKGRLKKSRSQSLPGTARLKNVSTSKAKSLAQVFGKLRPGNKSAKIPSVGDFNFSGTEHEHYMKMSSKGNLLDEKTAGEAEVTSTKRSHSSASTEEVSGQQPKQDALPYLIRKSLKLYFVRPPPRESSNRAFFLPPPSMALPNLPVTRRLKAIIPGAKIQVQIQIPSTIPIAGYAQTSQLVPCPKTGELVPSKGASGISHTPSDQYFGYNMKGRALDSNMRSDPRFPDNFQVALTVRKLTQSDILGSDSLRRRYECMNTIKKTSSFVNSTSPVPSNQGSGRERFPSGSYSPTGLGYVDPDTPLDESPVALDTAVEYTAIATNEPQHSPTTQKNDKSKSPSRPKKSWRKEVRVRKVECEFWQKESCRIPTEEAPSRSIKVPLGPAFVYSDKDQDQESNASQQDQDRDQDQDQDQDQDIDNEDNDASTHSPNMLTDTSNLASREAHTLSHTSSSASDIQNQDNKTQTLSNKTRRKENLGSSAVHVHSKSSSTYPQQSAGAKPFTLLVPVPLDSASLRQTFAWPSTTTPSPVHASFYDPSGTQGPGFGSEMIDSQSYPTMYEGAGVCSSRPGTLPLGGHGQILPLNPIGSSSKARIEVKHYLTFRISIDMLEFEGEPDEDDIDDLLGVSLEEQQQQQQQQHQQHQHSSNSPSLSKSVQQDLSVFPSTTSAMTSMPSACPPSMTTSPQHSANSTLATSNSNGGNNGSSALYPPLARYNGGFSTSSIILSSGSSSVSSGHISHSNNGNNNIAKVSDTTTASMNSPKGPMDRDVEDNGGLTTSPNLRAYDHSVRRGSRGSLGTVRSANSGTSSAVGTLAGQYSAQTTSSISDNSIGVSGVGNGTRGGGGNARKGRVTEGLVAGAIGVIKKKASGSLLTNVTSHLSPHIHSHGPWQQQQYPHHHQHHQQQQQRQNRLTKVSVQKLKDFVIRVPITVVVQADDQSRFAGNFGTTSSCGDQNGTAETHDSGLDVGLEMKSNVRTLGPMWPQTSLSSPSTFLPNGDGRAGLTLKSPLSHGSPGTMHPHPVADSFASTRGRTSERMDMSSFYSRLPDSNAGGGVSMHLDRKKEEAYVTGFNHYRFQNAGQFLGNGGTMFLEDVLDGVIETDARFLTAEVDDEDGDGDEVEFRY
ncbi:hypothetical protein BGZ94_004630 [Podila epigama]|nr:hypothetical protein BGZ94_004630 [Podila epigama]